MLVETKASEISNKISKREYDTPISGRCRSRERKRVPKAFVFKLWDKVLG
jgi:hypothetical protein